MPILTNRNRRKIRETMDFLNRNRLPVTFELESDEGDFTSKIIKVEHGGDSFQQPDGLNRYLIVEMLSPQQGNELIQSSPRIQVKFSLGRSKCGFSSRYIRKSILSPYYGHVIAYPECIIILDRRRHNRYAIDSSRSPLFVSVRLTLQTGPVLKRSYDLRVFDISENGVGVLLEEETLNLLGHLDFGCRLEELELLAPWTTVKSAGMVKHVSRIHKGRYDGCSLLGIQLDDTLERCV